MKISLLIKYLLFLLLLLLPSWGIIAAQVGYLVGFNEIVTSSRYLIIFFLFLFCFLGSILSEARLKYSFGFFLLFFYSIYSALHLISDAEPFLLFEGFRHEVLFVIMSLAFLAYGLASKGSSYLPSFEIIIITILLNGFVAVFFAIWQYIDVSVLELLYRKPLDDISNITLAIGYRLTSTMVNPINFGAYMVLLFIAVQYLYDNKKICFLIYFPIVLLIAVLIIGSLSRLALLAFIFVLIYFYLYKVSLFRFSIFIALAFISLFYVLNFVDIDLIMSRIDTVFVFSTYTENARVSNWISAVSSLEPYQYIWGRGVGASSPDSSVLAVTSALLIENAFVSVFIQYGLIGFIFMAALMFRFIYLGIRLGEYDVTVGKFVISFLVFFIIISLGNDFFRNSPFVLYFWFFYAYFEIIYVRYRCIA